MCALDFSFLLLYLYPMTPYSSHASQLLSPKLSLLCPLNFPPTYFFEDQFPCCLSQPLLISSDPLSKISNLKKQLGTFVVCIAHSTKTLPDQSILRCSVAVRIFNELKCETFTYFQFFSVLISYTKVHFVPEHISQFQ